MRSTGDSLGATVAQQKASIDQLIARHPKNILSLEHETLGLYSLLNESYDSNADIDLLLVTTM